MRNKRAGFTLIELLVVISIIAVLAALLLPAVGLVRNAAKQVNCMSNKRQVMMAIVTYADDWEGMTPPADSSISSPYACQARAYYTNLLYNEYLPNECVVAWQGGALMNAPSMRWPNVVSCTSFRPQSNPTGFTSNTAYGVYWCGNYANVKCTNTGSVRLSSLRDTPFLADTIATSTKIGSSGYWANNGYVNTFAVYLVHGNRTAVMGYGDGHVEALGRTRLLEAQVAALWP